MNLKRTRYQQGSIRLEKRKTGQDVWAYRWRELGPNGQSVRHMVGHSGKIPPTVRAVEVIDQELGRVYKAVKQRGGALLVTADHGNAEMLIDPVTGGPHTAHTTNPVPFILVTDAPKGTLSLRQDGSLRDISPTMLELLRLGKPKEMTGGDLRVAHAK